MLFFFSDDPRIRLSRSLNETAENDRDGPAGPGGEKYIESLVVVDPKMANFHGIDASKQYALTTCNIVSHGIELIPSPLISTHCFGCLLVSGIQFIARQQFGR